MKRFYSIFSCACFIYLFVYDLLRHATAIRWPPAVGLSHIILHQCNKQHNVYAELRNQQVYLMRLKVEVLPIAKHIGEFAFLGLREQQCRQVQGSFFVSSSLLPTSLITKCHTGSI